MVEFLKRNWLNGMGVVMVFTAFIYFLKLTTTEFNIPVELKLAVSSALGLGLIYMGVRQFHQKNLVLSQVLAGLGTAITFSTIGFVSFTEEISWGPETLMACMGIIVLVNTYIADKFNMYILAIISALGGLLTPLFLHASASYDVALFIYLLILNLGSLFLSIKKDWTLIRYICFAFSLILYAFYYHSFNPESWQKPFAYISVMFVLYAAGFLIASWEKLKSFHGLDLYLSIINSINFIYWSHFIFSDFNISYIIPISIVGLLFIAIALAIYSSAEELISPGAFIYFILGIISISISGNEVALQFHDGGVNYLITGFMWLFIIGLAYSIIRLVSSSQMILLVILGFISLSVYWFMHAWDVDWIPLFGVKYIPFINLGAMLWILLAILGFSISKYLMDNTVADCDKNTVGFDLLTLLSSSCALISHLVLGGLLTIQIMNLWEAYEISFLTRGLMVSLMWFIYAVLLFRWSYKTNQKLFKIIGILVVLVSSLKVFILDLNGESSVEKIVFLVVFGGVLFLIGKLNQREREKNILPESPSETLEPDSAPAKKHDAFWKKF